MSLISMGVAGAAVISLVVAITRLVSGERQSDNFDVGSVSKEWLSEHWAQKDA